MERVDLQVAERGVRIDANCSSRSIGFASRSYARRSAVQQRIARSLICINR